MRGGQEQDWQMTPIGGASGDAYMGVKNNERVFFKRNSSPFIAALSAQGITPKLMWTQRTYSGDLLVAQEWKDGHLLSREDMGQEKVIQLIRSIHQSDYLLMMLKRSEDQLFYPLDFIALYLKDLPAALCQHHFFNEVIHSLEDALDDDFYNVNYCVCHGDLHHLNFLEAEDGQLYLVDWENVRIADPLSDLSRLLCEYYRPSDWTQWLKTYGLRFDATTYKRVQWYSQINCLLIIKHYYQENRFDRMNELVLLLKSIYQGAQADKRRLAHQPKEFF